MKLTVSERYTLLDILPKEGTYTTLKIVRKLRESLSFTEDEISRYEIKEAPMPGGGFSVSWNLTMPQEVEIEIGEKATDVIVTSLKKLDTEGTLTMREMPLYEKFVEK